MPPQRYSIAPCDLPSTDRTSRSIDVRIVGHVIVLAGTMQRKRLPRRSLRAVALGGKDQVWRSHYSEALGKSVIFPQFFSLRPAAAITGGSACGWDDHPTTSVADGFPQLEVRDYDAMRSHGRFRFGSSCLRFCRDVAGGFTFGGSVFTAFSALLEVWTRNPHGWFGCCGMARGFLAGLRGDP